MTSHTFEDNRIDFMSSKPSRLPDPVSQKGFYEGVIFRRTAAYFIDIFIILGIWVISIPATLGISLIIAPFSFLITAFLYRYFTTRRLDATFGMRMMDLEFRAYDGWEFDNRLSLWHAALTSIIHTIFFLNIVNAACVFFSARRQSLVDMMLGTTVINEFEILTDE